MPTYNTLAQLTSLEIPKIQGSRFIATAFPAREESEVVEQRLRLAKLYPTANHHCWAWRGEDPQKFRCSDDGEPYGSAGIPILKAIEGRELSATAVIVTRIFGGTKLGVGGLVRAYTAASCNVLDLSPRVEQVLTVAVTLDYGYPHTPQVEAMLHRFAAVT